MSRTQQIRGLKEWNAWCVEKGTSGDQVFDILEDWRIENQQLQDQIKELKFELAIHGELTKNDLGNYMKAQAEKRTAYERHNYAGVALENAQIKERLAEIKSQHEPLAGLLTQSLSERNRLYAAAFYVVVGRMPT